MKKSCLLGAVCATVIMLSTLSSQAAPVLGQGTWETTLQGRDMDGNTSTIEGYYDTVLDITWLADSNYSMTSGYDADGQMSWVAANAWAAGLDINGIAEWRLPIMSPIDGISFNMANTLDGTSDRGQTLTTTDGTDGGWRDSSGTPVSEMGHMFYVNLANIGLCTTSFSPCDVQPGWGVNNTGPFINYQHGSGPITTYQTAPYWYGTDYIADDGFDQWAFLINDLGNQTTTNKTSEYFAWAVHDGSVGVAVVPLPPAFWLFSSALVCLVGMARRKSSGSSYWASR